MFEHTEGRSNLSRRIFDKTHDRIKRKRVVAFYIGLFLPFFLFIIYYMSFDVIFTTFSRAIRAVGEENAYIDIHRFFPITETFDVGAKGNSRSFLYFTEVIQ